MTKEERLAKMHSRAAELKRRREKREIRSLGVISCGLLFGLVTLIFSVQYPQHGIAAGQHTGASLLSDSVGGYVLVAVLAFTLGVVVTAIIRWYRARARGNDRNEDSG